MRQSKYDAAAEILTGGAKALLRAGSQQGASASGGDLAIMLVTEVYTKAEWEISEENDSTSRAHKSKFGFDLRTRKQERQKLMFIYLFTERLIELLREFPPDEPSRKRYISEIIGWSSKFGPLERGDPELHHAVGSVYAEGTLLRSHINQPILTFTFCCN